MNPETDAFILQYNNRTYGPAAHNQVLATQLPMAELLGAGTPH